MNAKTTKPHIHLHVFLKDKKSGKTLHEAKELYKATTDRTIHSILDQFSHAFTYEFVTERYRQDYSFDKDGATEYIKYTAHCYDEDNTYYSLTIHVFSCYCEPLNENQVPPF